MRRRFVSRMERMGGEWFYMIYRRSWFGGLTFWERWNASESAAVRLSELNGENTTA